VIKSRTLRNIAVAAAILAAVGLSGGVAGQAQAASDETYPIAVIGDVPYAPR
jgi:hypothetical protein